MLFCHQVLVQDGKDALLHTHTRIYLCVCSWYCSAIRYWNRVAQMLHAHLRMYLCVCEWYCSAIRYWYREAQTASYDTLYDTLNDTLNDTLISFNLSGVSKSYHVHICVYVCVCEWYCSAIRYWYRVAKRASYDTLTRGVWWCLNSLCMKDDTLTRCVWRMIP